MVHQQPRLTALVPVWEENAEHYTQSDKLQVVLFVFHSLFQKQNLTEQEVNEAGLVIKYFANNTDNMASKFFDAILPGWTLNDPYNLAAPLMISKNPGAVLLSIAIFKNQETCNNFNMSSLPKCETGFVLDQISGWCFKFLEQELNFWQASDACLELVSDLVEFESDLDVKGFIQYLRSGIKCPNITFCKWNALLLSTFKY